MHSRAFDGLTGEFPIGFLIWDTNKKLLIDDVHVSVVNKAGHTIGVKTFANYDKKPLLTEWVARPASNDKAVVPLKNAVMPATASRDLRGTKWSVGAVGWLNCAGNDLQNANSKTMLFSSGYGSARGFFVNADNLSQAAVVFAVRRLIAPSWLNDRDQFLQPSKPLTDTFKADCLVWMLFNGSNLSAGAEGLKWNGRSWTIVNHFIPYTEKEVGAHGRFESDFMAKCIKKLKNSSEAQAVLDAGLDLWRQYHSRTFGRLFATNIN